MARVAILTSESKGLSDYRYFQSSVLGAEFIVELRTK